MKKSETYVLPIWIDIVCHGYPLDIMIDFNQKLTEFFESYGEKVEGNGNSINIQWSINKHIKI